MRFLSCGFDKSKRRGKNSKTSNNSRHSDWFSANCATEPIRVTIFDFTFCERSVLTRSARGPRKKLGQVTYLNETDGKTITPSLPPITPDPKVLLPFPTILQLEFRRPQFQGNQPHLRISWIHFILKSHKQPDCFKFRNDRKTCSEQFFQPIFSRRESASARYISGVNGMLLRVRSNQNYVCFVSHQAIKFTIPIHPLATLYLFINCIC